MSFDFPIPMGRDDLLRKTGVNQYVVDEVFPVRVLAAKLQECKMQFRVNGPAYILTHFDSLFSILRHEHSVEVTLIEDIWDLLVKALNQLAHLLVDIVDHTEVDASTRQDHLNTLKMTCYLLCQFTESFEAEATKPSATSMGKGRKKSSRADLNLGKIDWESEREKGVRALLHVLQLNVKRLWDPPVVEEEFVNMVTCTCYRLLENINVSRNKTTRDTIFQLLGVMVKKYNHALGCSLKLIQLLQHFEHLAAPLAHAVAMFANEFGMKNIVGEIMREIGRMDTKDLARDTTGTRAFAAFLVELAEQIPAIMMPNISVLLGLLDGESYTMRNSVLGVLGEMVVRVLSKEDLDDKQRTTRDQFIDRLEDHIHDVNAFVRSRTMQIWIFIVNEQALPLPRRENLLELVIGRLQDKSSQVRKYAVQLITALLRKNPFAAKLSLEELKENLATEKQKLAEMEPEDKQEETAKKELETEWGKIETQLRVEVEKDRQKEEDEEKKKKKKQKAASATLR